MRPRAAISAGLLALAASGASAQTGPIGPAPRPPIAGVPGQPAQPVRVEQTVADRDPLHTSLRQLPTDLRQDEGFEHLYRVPGADNRFMRRSGAITAVFPRSQYVATRQGPLPVIPAGTVFYFGLPPADQLAHDAAPRPMAGAAPSASGRIVRSELLVEAERLGPAIDSRIDPRPAAQPPPTAAPAPAAPAISDDAYRARRLHEIARRHAD
ncbi:MAG: hypothetical protein IBJ11_11730 [Phycisphaerales bacterium]|nr:hypothetical protein [Phycisphaerales bacterium]